MNQKNFIIGLIILSIFAIIGIIASHSIEQAKPMDALLLLKPNLPINSKYIEGWLNSAADEGLHLHVEFDKDFLYSKKLSTINYKGIILADQIHSKVSVGLAQRLKAYVESGGYLMLVYDAGTQDLDGSFYPHGSLFSELLNLNYGLNENNVGSTFQTVGHTEDILEALGIPPGKYIPVTHLQDRFTGSIDSFNAISGYGYGPLKYKHLITQKVENNVPLLLTTIDHQFIAGIVNHGKGKILFINLPLTELWIRTDSLFLHTFLRYFASDMLHLPTLSTVPNGVGGIILNLHVESSDDIKSLAILHEHGVFKQGPHSIDFTAGPDLTNFGDHKGTDIVHNPIAQKWMHYFVSLGHAVGSDGGWIHDYYGVYASEKNQNEFQKYISMNNEAIEKILGQKVLEYVPSVGNQPNWATRYLEQEHFLGYYTASNTGTGPTQNFRDGLFDASFLWSFPVLPYGKHACFRDFGTAKIPVENVTRWLLRSTEFMSSHHAARLMYFHPADIYNYPQYLSSLDMWLNKAKSLTDQRSFQWFSMVNLSRFLSTRRDVIWKTQKRDHLQIIKAEHPISLEKQAWLINKKSCQKPTINIGSGEIREDERNWIVISGDEKKIEFQCAKNELSDS
jgi:hypothetical protein